MSWRPWRLGLLVWLAVAIGTSLPKPCWAWRTGWRWSQGRTWAQWYSRVARVHIESCDDRDAQVDVVQSPLDAQGR